ncbi:MAG: DNA gyrase inhibitor YacG [Lautropia sp.]|nr:DNA gyrase inhibitor YacG [Lautropia sp.]
MSESNAPQPRPLLVSCPTCQQDTVYSTENRWRPFCSERCRMIDLGAWSDESYVVPGQPIEADDDLLALPDALHPLKNSA